MPTWLIPIIVAIFSGLLWLAYKHPQGSRRLFNVLFAIVTGVFGLAATYQFGAFSQFQKLQTFYPNIKNEDRIYYLNELAYGFFGAAIAYAILTALSFYFDGLKKEQNK